nr:hypothetical protein [Okeania sp. SIO2F4]
MIIEDNFASIDADKIFLMGGISWEVYEQLLKSWQDNYCCRVTFL